MRDLALLHLTVTGALLALLTLVVLLQAGTRLARRAVTRLRATPPARAAARPALQSSSA